MDKIRVEGMHCDHCRLAVEVAMNQLSGAKGVKVDLEKGIVSWESIGVTMEVIKETIEDLGFDVVDEEDHCSCGQNDCGCGCC